MLMRLYSVYDRVARVYADPFVSVNDATAARFFTVATSNPESLLFAAPADFQLWYIGSMDNTNAHFLTQGDSEPYKVVEGQPREVPDHE